MTTTHCARDGRACPFQGCSDSLCSRHEFVPVSPYPCDETPARAARNTPTGAAMRAESPAPRAEHRPGTSSRRGVQI